MADVARRQLIVHHCAVGEARQVDALTLHADVGLEIVQHSVNEADVVPAGGRDACTSGVVVSWSAGISAALVAVVVPPGTSIRIARLHTLRVHTDRSTQTVPALGTVGAVLPAVFAAYFTAYG